MILYVFLSSFFSIYSRDITVCNTYIFKQLHQELEAIKARVKEMEEEAEKLKDMQKEIEGSLNLSMSPTTTGTMPENQKM